MSSLRGPALRFTVARFGLFIVVAMLIWSGTGAAGHQLNGVPLLFLALLISSVASLFLFRRQRDAFATALADKRAAKVAEIAERRARLENDAT